jgi:hypothetical protein
MGPFARKTVRSTVLSAMLAMTPAAHAVETLADIETATELDSIALSVAAIHRDRLSRCENAAGELQFELYREYNHSIGMWQSIDALRDLVDLAVDAASPVAEQQVRTDIVDHARFVASELDAYVEQLSAKLFVRGPTPDWQLRDEIRLARQARDVVERLKDDRAPR